MASLPPTVYISDADGSIYANKGYLNTLTLIGNTQQAGVTGNPVLTTPSVAFGNSYQYTYVANGGVVSMQQLFPVAQDVTGKARIASDLVVTGNIAGSGFSGIPAYVLPNNVTFQGVVANVIAANTATLGAAFVSNLTVQSLQGFTPPAPNLSAIAGNNLSYLTANLANLTCNTATFGSIFVSNTASFAPNLSSIVGNSLSYQTANVNTLVANQISYSRGTGRDLTLSNTVSALSTSVYAGGQNLQLGNAATPQIQLNYSGGGGLFAHAIRSRHSSFGPQQNAIDLYTWQPSDGAYGVANNAAMSVTSTGVGVGTTSPGALLDVAGNARMQGLSANLAQIQTLYCSNVIGLPNAIPYSLPSSIAVSNLTVSNIAQIQTLYCSNVIGLPNAIPYTLPSSIAVSNLTVSNTAQIQTLYCSNVIGLPNAIQYTLPSSIALSNLAVSNVAQIQTLYCSNIIGLPNTTSYTLPSSIAVSNLAVSNTASIGNTLSCQNLTVLNTAAVNNPSGFTVLANSSLNCYNYNQYANAIVNLSAGGSGSASAGLYLAGYSGRGMPAGTVLASDDGAGGVNMTFGTCQGYGFAQERMRITNAGLVGFGTTSPQANVDVAGSLRCSSTLIANTANIKSALSVGNAVSPAIVSIANPAGNTGIFVEAGTLSDGTNTGWNAINFNGWFNSGDVYYNPARSRWRMVVDQRSTTEAFTLDSLTPSAYTTYLRAQQGCVGILNASPAYPLDVMGAGRFTGNVSLLTSCNQQGQPNSAIGAAYPCQQIFGYGGGGYAHAIRTRHNSGSAAMNAIDLYTWQPSDGVSNLPNTAPLSVTSAGIGVNNYYPSYALDVNGTARAANVRLASTNAYLTGGPGGSAAGDYMQIVGGGGTTGLVVSYNGLVGIQNTSPQAPLDVNGTIRCSSVLTSNVNNRGYYAIPVSIASTVGAFTQPFNITNPSGNWTFGLRVTLVQSAGYNAVLKVYEVPQSYNTRPTGNWQRVLPAYNSGSSNGNDFAFDIIISDRLYARVVRTAVGSNINTSLTCYVDLLCDTQDQAILNLDGYQGSNAGISGNYAFSPPVVQSGQVGIGCVPAYALDVSGPARFQGSSFSQIFQNNNAAISLATGSNSFTYNTSIWAYLNIGNSPSTSDISLGSIWNSSTGSFNIPVTGLWHLAVDFGTTSSQSVSVVWSFSKIGGSTTYPLNNIGCGYTSSGNYCSGSTTQYALAGDVANFAINAAGAATVAKGAFSIKTVLIQRM